MSRDLKRISLAAIVLLVVLRVSIGWQFLYEGLWKIQSQKTADPWTSAGYLKNAQGPFRDHFRSLTGDPDDLSWLDYETVAQRWNEWHKAFVEHYRLDDAQKAQLDKMLNGDVAFVAALKELPPEVRKDVDEKGNFRGSLHGTVRFDARRQRLIVDGKKHLQPDERDALLRKSRDPAWRKAVSDVYERSHRHANHEVTGLAFKERLRAHLQGDPENYGIVARAAGRDAEQETKVRLGKIDVYKQMVADLNDAAKRANTDYQREHLDALRGAGYVPGWGLQELKNDVVGPVKALDAELRDEAQLLLTPEQIARGPVSLPMTPIEQIDWLTMWSLAIIGVLLIAGFATPLAALAGAGLLMLFYLAVPPWPGVPEAPGPEHSFIVNKNLIEALALLSIALLPTGRWFGLDAIVHWLWVRLTGRKPASQTIEKKTPARTAEKPKPAAAPTT